MARLGLLLVALVLAPLLVFGQIPTASFSHIVFAVGDMMQGYQAGNEDEETVRKRVAGTEAIAAMLKQLLDWTLDSTGITLGDNSNDAGSEEDYDYIRQSGWGLLSDRLYPSPGNHDYQTDQVFPPYFRFFTEAMGPERNNPLGFYYFKRGPWLLISLNTELPEHLRPQQLGWLEDALRNNRTKCTLAYFHRPAYSSGRYGSPRGREIFKTLYKYGVDLVLNGHEHFYSRTFPLNPDGKRDEQYGIRQIIAGTGGAIQDEQFAEPEMKKFEERMINSTLGILKLTLHEDGYDWEFLPLDPEGPTDSGSGSCHDKPPGYTN